MKVADFFDYNQDSLNNLQFTCLTYFISFFTYWFHMSPLSMGLIDVDELDLECKINQLKRELIRIAGEKGLNSPDTIYCSQQLDQLITLYQEKKYGNSTLSSFQS
nr:aspartyl-phosphate phosphatase Spo0E family protein [uncultured Bacillus sp.]